MYKIYISMARMRGTLCLLFSILLFGIMGTANIGIARETDKKGAPTTVQPSNEVRSARKVKPEWRMPDFYPADGFNGMGQLDEISTRDNLVIINDMRLKLSRYTEYHTPTIKNASSTFFKQGDKVGYILDSQNTIVSMWLIVIKK